MPLEDLVEQLRRDSASFNTLFPDDDRNLSKIIGKTEGEQKLTRISGLSDFLIEQGFNSYHSFSIVGGAGWKEKLKWIAKNYEPLLKPMGFTGYHVSQIVRNKDWEEKLDWITENYESLLKPMGFKCSHVSQIVRNKDWEAKLDWITGHYESLLKPMGFKGSHVSQIVRNTGWKEKLDWITGHYESLLKPMGFKCSHVSQIVAGKDWEAKLDWITGHYESLLRPMEFTGYHVSQIVVGKDWEAKLDWITGHYESLLKPMGFKGSHVSQIVRNKDWEAKLDWIMEYYEPLLKPMGFNGYYVSQIVSGKDWEKKLKWIEEHYLFFKEHGLSKYRLSLSLNTKDWQSKTQAWLKNKELFDVISFDDKRISPLVEGYIRDLIFEGADRATVSSLISKCTSEKIEKFESDVYSISAIQTKDSVDVVLKELNDTFGYSTEEINMYLVAINKNQRGLLSWYNSGEKTKPYAVSLDRLIPKKDDRSLSELIQTEERSVDEVIETENAVEHVYLNIINSQPENKELWHKFIYSYECDMDNFTPEERTQFNKALRGLRANKALLGDIYGILKS